jgi:hypothetical protein
MGIQGKLISCLEKRVFGNKRIAPQKIKIEELQILNNRLVINNKFIVCTKIVFLI